VLGAARITAASLSVADLMTYLLCVAILVDPINRAVNIVRLWQEGLTGFDRFMDMLEIAPDIRDRPSARALSDVRGATFTLTNVGMIADSRWQTPLVPTSQCAILATGAIREAPVVRNGAIVVGRVMSASLTFDHRIVSGVPAALFLKTFGALLAGSN